MASNLRLACVNRDVMSDPESALTEVDAAGCAAALAERGLLLVDYCADHCIWCERLESVLAVVAPGYRNRIRFIRVNVTKYPAARPVDLRGTPTLALYRDGQLVMSKTGMMQRGQLAAFLDHYLDPANTGLA